MDYCTSCRRHLNGALVCPGCGAYAPDIAPATIDSRVAPSRPTGTTAGSVMIPLPPTTPAAPMVPTLPAATWGYGATDGGWPDGPVADEPAADGFTTAGFTTAGPASGIRGVEMEADADAVADMDVDVEGVPAAPQGRAARRRQVARWKKNQRRAVVATAVALVGGGLTVLGMDRQSTDRTQAATAPDAESLGSVEEQGSQRGRTPATETDDARRTADTPTTWSPSGDTSRDRGAAADRPNSRPNHPNSPHTASADQSAQKARTGSSTTDGTADDTATPTDGTTTPPATDDSGSSADTGTSTGSDTGTGTGTGTDTGADSSGSGTDTGSDSGTGTGTGTSDGSGSDTATTSPSGLCLLGIVCVS
ncbi:SCO2400 family protein [Streptomyces europaeiscabiei]|uniref:SCO2400 family protein n=1 Tax=Streptomyces europaeiscabiei TaxID=146819 RepID=UPI0038F66AD4